MKRAKVKFTHDDSLYNEFKAGEVGYIDGYVRGGDNSPCVAIIKEGGWIVLASPWAFKVINFNELGE